MKNIQTLSAVFFAALLFSSCKKDSSNASSAALPKTYTETITSSVLGNSTTTYNLTYDGSNRITSLAAASGSGNKFVYAYSSNSYTLDLYNSNVLSIHEVFYINSSLGFVDSTFQYNDTNDSTTEKYFYNSSKQLVEVKQYDYSKIDGSSLSNTTHYTYDPSGNVIQDADDNGTRTYTYYSDLKNTVTLGQIYFPLPVNLSKTISYTSGGSTVINNQTYTFDSNNRVSSEKDVLSTGDVLVKTYTY